MAVPLNTILWHYTKPKYFCQKFQTIKNILFTTLYSFRTVKRMLVLIMETAPRLTAKGYLHTPNFPTE